MFEEEPPREEEQIKEILTEVTSQFNFMAPAESDPEDCDPPASQPENGLSFISPPVETENGAFAEPLQENIAPPPAHSLPDPTPTFNGLNAEPAPVVEQATESVKDELNWQQKAQQNKTYSRSTTQGGYKNSQRYQRQFNGARQANG